MTFSESWAFIWHPKVSRYKVFSGAITSLSIQGSGFRDPRSGIKSKRPMLPPSAGTGTSLCAAASQLSKARTWGTPFAAGRPSSQTGMEIGEESRHLCVVEAASEGGHQPLAGEDHGADVGICGGSAAGQCAAAENVV